MSRHVTLICGPPCSGKTTLAEQLAQPGDFVLDLDRIARRLGSPTRWRHERGVIEHALEIYRAALGQLAITDDVTAYVVNCAPNPQARHKLASGIRADVVCVLRPPMATCLHRARQDNRPPGTLTSIRRWYQIYRAHPLDASCPSAHPEPAPTRPAVGTSGPAGTPPGSDPTARPPATAGTTPAGSASLPSPNASSAPSTGSTSARTAGSPKPKRKRKTTR